MWCGRNSPIFSLPGIVVFATIGLLLGIVVQQNDPSDDAVTWAGTVGDLFLRAVWCLVSPLVLCSIVESLLDLFEDGRAGRVSKYALLLYALATVVATLEGLVLALAFKHAFTTPELTDDADARVAVQVACGDAGDSFLHHFANGSIACTDISNSASSASAESDPWTFWLSPVNDSASLFSDSSVTAAAVNTSITDTLQEQLHSLVPDSIAAAFVNGDLLSIVTFATFFTIALAAPGHRPLGNLSGVIRDLNAVLMRMISWVVHFWTPFAILSLLTKAIGGSDDLGTLFSNAGLFMLCEICALAVHGCVFYPIVIATLGKFRNPFAWLAQMFRAQVVAFGCASSMGTLPEVMKCVEETRIMPATLSRFLLAIGATVGKDGSAASFPVAIIFMATASGTQLTAAQIASTTVLSVIGSVATGPVPSAGVIMIAAIWKSVTSSDPPMELFNLIVGADWLLDRFRTVINVTCDTVVCRVIASHVCPDYQYEPLSRNLESFQSLGSFGNSRRSSDEFE